MMCRLSTSTHWGRVTHMCVGNVAIIGSDNGLSPGRRQAIIRTNAGILLKGPLGTNFSELLIEILIFSFAKMRLKVSSAKRRPFSRHQCVNKKICRYDMTKIVQCTLLTSVSDTNIVGSGRLYRSMLISYPDLAMEIDVSKPVMISVGYFL